MCTSNHVAAVALLALGFWPKGWLVQSPTSSLPVGKIWMGKWLNATPQIHDWGACELAAQPLTASGALLQAAGCFRIVYACVHSLCAVYVCHLFMDGINAVIKFPPQNKKSYTVYFYTVLPSPILWCDSWSNMMGSFLHSHVVASLPYYLQWV